MTKTLSETDGASVAEGIPMPDVVSATDGESVTEIGLWVITTLSEIDGESIAERLESRTTKSLKDGKSFRILTPAVIVS